jgi:hypothetical protein
LPPYAALARRRPRSGNFATRRPQRRPIGGSLGVGRRGHLGPRVRHGRRRGVQGSRLALTFARYLLCGDSCPGAPAQALAPQCTIAPGCRAAGWTARRRKGASHHRRALPAAAGGPPRLRRFVSFRANGRRVVFASSTNIRPAAHAIDHHRACRVAQHR